jgi:hypothetical protein
VVLSWNRILSRQCPRNSSKAMIADSWLKSAASGDKVSVFHKISTQRGHPRSHVDGTVTESGYSSAKDRPGAWKHMCEFIRPCKDYDSVDICHVLTVGPTPEQHVGVCTSPPQSSLRLPDILWLDNVHYGLNSSYCILSPCWRAPALIAIEHSGISSRGQTRRLTSMRYDPTHRAWKSDTVKQLNDGISVTIPIIIYNVPFARNDVGTSTYLLLRYSAMNFPRTSYCETLAATHLELIKKPYCRVCCYPTIKMVM